MKPRHKLHPPMSARARALAAQRAAADIRLPPDDPIRRLIEAAARQPPPAPPRWSALLAVGVIGGLLAASLVLAALWAWGPEPQIVREAAAFRAVDKRFRALPLDQQKRIWNRLWGGPENGRDAN